ncbi:putative alcohol dehydrogenase [Diaporthe ampelina]|uniref:Putative alcohol dehydrogenase n=1 Tax=Diaporthe ampelina TaxID=1214573 RepID=A0A0G2F3C7_9PEZI|nr:putative alcohol dehydrogenase [Diaporthe ampelina]
MRYTALRSNDPWGGFGPSRTGGCADYAVATEDLLLPKPAHLSFEEAASLLGGTLTAMALNPAAFPHQSLEGKTALVTAGLEAATSIACQVLKNVYGASEVIATGHVRAVTTVVPLDSLETIKKRCEEVLTLKGGVGKLVIKLV